MTAFPFPELPCFFPSLIFFIRPGFDGFFFFLACLPDTSLDGDASFSGGSVEPGTDVLGPHVGIAVGLCVGAPDRLIGALEGVPPIDCSLAFFFSFPVRLPCGAQVGVAVAVGLATGVLIEGSTEGFDDGLIVVSTVRSTVGDIVEIVAILGAGDSDGMLETNGHKPTGGSTRSSCMDKSIV